MTLDLYIYVVKLITEDFFHGICHTTVLDAASHQDIDGLLSAGIVLVALPHDHRELAVLWNVVLGSAVPGVVTHVRGLLGNGDENTRLDDQRLEDGEDGGRAPRNAEL